MACNYDVDSHSMSVQAPITTNHTTLLVLLAVNCLCSACDSTWTMWRVQADLKRRADELEKKTAGVDVLNRKADKIRAAQDGGPETGGALCISQPVYSHGNVSGAHQS